MDDRVIYLVIALSILIPLVKPLKLPLCLSTMTKDAFNVIDNLLPGTRIFIAIEIDPADVGESLSQMIVIHRHVLSKGVRIIYCPLNPASAPYLIKIVDQFKDECKSEYGKDVVILPFRPGGETAVVQIAGNFWALYNEDYYSKPLRDMEIMRGFNDISDLDLVVAAGAGDAPTWFIRHVQATKGVKLVVSCTAVSTPSLSPFYASGQVLGIVSGSAGAAEYEYLANKPGKAIAGMDAQSLGQVLLIVLILLGNVSMLALRRGTSRKAGEVQ
jgi:hypothetical protein